MRNYYLMYYKPKQLLISVVVIGTILSALLTWGISFMDEKVGFSYYQYPTASAILIGLFILITEKLWKYKPFNWLFIVTNLNGRYEGKISFIHPLTNKKSEKMAVMEIIQTGATIKIRSFFQKKNGTEYTVSESDVETIKKLDDGSFELHFTYRNKGEQCKLSDHCGTNILRCYKNEEGQFMEGIYYTNRDPQTKGEIKLKFESKKLKHTI